MRLAYHKPYLRIHFSGTYTLSLYKGSYNVSKATMLAIHNHDLIYRECSAVHAGTLSDTAMLLQFTNTRMPPTAHAQNYVIAKVTIKMEK